MLPIVVLNQAWKEALGWSSSDVASVIFDLDSDAATVPAGPGDVCPRCRRHPVDSFGWMFVPEPATSTPAQVKGRQVVVCLCTVVYSFDAVHAVTAGEPLGTAVVRSVSAPQPALPPGANTTLDEANRVASRPTSQTFPYFHAVRQLLYPDAPRPDWE